MGNHYIPKYYLRGFCRDFRYKLWVYDKQDNRKFWTQVKSIANKCGFYPPELETYLAEKIENPANEVLEKIRNREPLTLNDKKVLSIYIGVMWKRVPKSKNRVKESVPKIAHDMRQTLHRQVDEALLKNPVKKALAERRKIEIDEILDRFSDDPPAEIWHQTIPIERTPRIALSIATMTWLFITFDEKPVFLTGDNPVFHSSDIGIEKSESELSFPISSHSTLWATRRIDLPESYYPVNMKIVKEMNRRTASNTERYIFHSEEEDWILPFIKKKQWKLNRIV